MIIVISVALAVGLAACVYQLCKAVDGVTS
jgi:hypothetical protein